MRMKPTKHPTKDLPRYLQCLVKTPLRIKVNPTKDLNANPNGLDFSTSLVGFPPSQWDLQESHGWE